VIDEVDTLLAAHGIGASYQNFEAQSALILSRADIFRAIFSAAVLFIAGIGTLGLLSTLSISVFERRREIGIMRSVGASSVAIGTQFFTEGLVVGVLDWTASIPRWTPRANPFHTSCTTSDLHTSKPHTIN
jgi:ABC-type antimicrobial peptide transport system permease subunit